MRVITICFTLAFLALNTFAGNENYLLGARQAGLANSTVALSDVWSTSQNQAGLGEIKSVSAGLAYENRFLIPEFGLKGLALAVPVGGGAFGLNVSSFGYSSYSESKIGIGYGRRLAENLLIGVQMDYLRVQLGDIYGTQNTFVAELGMKANLTNKLSVAAHVYNINRAKLAAYNDERVPTVLRLGGLYEFSEKVLLVAEVEKDIQKKASVKAGMEYHVTKPLYFRAGFSSEPFKTAFGVGLDLNLFKIDISTSYHPQLGFTPQMSLTYQMTKK